MKLSELILRDSADEMLMQIRRIFTEGLEVDCVEAEDFLIADIFDIFVNNKNILLEKEDMSVVLTSLLKTEVFENEWRRGGIAKLITRAVQRIQNLEVLRVFLDETKDEPLGIMATFYLKKYSWEEGFDECLSRMEKKEEKLDQDFFKALKDVTPADMKNFCLMAQNKNVFPEITSDVFKTMIQNFSSEHIITLSEIIGEKTFYTLARESSSATALLDPNRRKADGDTLEVLKFFQRIGLNLIEKNSLGVTPLMLAEMQNLNLCTDFLKTLKKVHDEKEVLDAETSKESLVEAVALLLGHGFKIQSPEGKEIFSPSEVAEGKREETEMKRKRL